jgi:hypothetical protein
MAQAELPFSPLGLTVSFTAATTVPTAVAALSANPITKPAYQYRVVNAGTQLVFMGVGVDAATAQAAADAVGAIPILPGAVEVIGYPTGSFFSGKTASGTAVIYITPGEGL